MNAGSRIAMSLYVAIAIHLVVLLAFGLPGLSQDSAGPSPSGLRLLGDDSPVLDQQLAELTAVLADLGAAADDPAEHSVDDGGRGESPQTGVARVRPRAPRLKPKPEGGPVQERSEAISTDPRADAAEGGGGVNHYLVRLRQHLARQRLGMPLQWEGAQVLVGFDLQADGGVGRLRVVESSGIPEMDRAVLDLVRRSLPLPRPPAALLGPLLVPVAAGN